MDYKILALDIDGTLADSKKRITGPVKRRLKGLYDRNIPVLLVSGRATEGIMPVAREIELCDNDGYILAFNGGKIIHAGTKEVLYEKSVPHELVAPVCEFAKKHNLVILTYKDGNIISTDSDNQYVQLESRITGMPVVKTDDMLKDAPYSPSKFLMVEDGEILAGKTELMKKEFEGKLNVFRSEPFFMEIVPLGIDKAESLGVLLDKLNLTKEELVACGDGRNDVTMIDYAGMGVAMANACDEVKAVSNFVTLSNDEDGVAVAIDKFF